MRLLHSSVELWSGRHVVVVVEARGQPIKKMEEYVAVGIGCRGNVLRGSRKPFFFEHLSPSPAITPFTCHLPWASMPFFTPKSLSPSCTHSFLVLYAEPTPAFQSSARNLRAEYRRPCPNMEKIWGRGVGSCDLEGQFIAVSPVNTPMHLLMEAEVWPSGL